MRRIYGARIYVAMLAALLLDGVTTTGLRAQDGTGAGAEAGIEAVIDGQMQAFRAEDVEGAFSFASPNIKGIFGSPENFGTMVQRGYPMVWDNADIRYLELREIDGRLWQKVIVQDEAGTLHALDYQMIETPDGWQIDGVQLLDAPDVGA